MSRWKEQMTKRTTFFVGVVVAGINYRFGAPAQVAIYAGLAAGFAYFLTLHGFQGDQDAAPEKRKVDHSSALYCAVFFVAIGVAALSGPLWLRSMETMRGIESPVVRIVFAAALQGGSAAFATSFVCWCATRRSCGRSGDERPES